MNYLELAGAAVGLVYLWLEYKASVWLWLASIVMPAIYIFVYYDTGFYADMGINVYYLFASVYGWLIWTKKKSDGDPLKITHTPKKYILPLTLITVLAYAAIAYLLVNHTDSTVPYGDSATTALSITALWMLSRKYVEQWLVWLAVDILCTILYLYKGLYPTAVLYGIYSVIAVAGYFKWLKLMKNDIEVLPDA